MLEVKIVDNKEFSKELESRTKKFAIQIISLSSALPFTPESKVIRNQITKSGTSIGANYSEANRSKSKADFSYKIKICESEASETIFWLEIIDELNLSTHQSIKSEIAEAKELLAIFTSIGRNLKLKQFNTPNTSSTSNFRH